MTATASCESGRSVQVSFSPHTELGQGVVNLPRAPDVAEEEVPLLAVGEGDAVAHRLALRRDEPHGLRPRGADRRYEDDGQRDGEHGGGEDDDKGGGAQGAVEADKLIALLCAVAELRRRGGGWCEVARSWERGTGGARTWMTTPDAKQHVRSRLAMHARQRSSERR